MQRRNCKEVKVPVVDDIMLEGDLNPGTSNSLRTSVSVLPCLSLENLNPFSR